MRRFACLKCAASTAVILWVFFGCGGSTSSGGGGTDAGAVYDDCSDNSDCVIRPASCCGQCGAATRDDIVALNKARATAYETANCEEMFGCPACYMAQDARLVATCTGGKCAVVDLAQHASTECGATSDCRIRTNACCECGGPTDVEHVIAIAGSAEASFSALVCDEAQACPECAPVYPPEMTAVCTDGHCEAVSVQP
jgi:hypothetical protein